MSINFKQVYAVDKKVKAIAKRVHAAMGAPETSAKLYEVVAAITRDPEMIELMTDDTNRLALITAYLDHLVWFHRDELDDEIDNDPDAEQNELSA
jgi:hypothetical protein